ncbi:DUF4352 domain-containing protein [Natronorubrum sp. FCH18a]|uniref:DUF4352 domain-containing protein n=1 Tax=Natronorubrum sp. FCH18a TaxID=3447018 RepID=UPI003F511D91
MGMAACTTISGLAGCTSDPEDPADAAGGQATNGSKIVERGEWVSIGDLEIAVQDANLDEREGNIFVAVQVEIVNIGNVTLDIDDNLFYLVDGQERIYETSSDLMRHYDDGLTREQVNPDLSIIGALFFIVPEDQNERYLVMQHHEESTDEHVVIDLGELERV